MATRFSARGPLFWTGMAVLCATCFAFGMAWNASFNIEPRDSVAKVAFIRALCGADYNTCNGTITATEKGVKEQYDLAHGEVFLHGNRIVSPLPGVCTGTTSEPGTCDVQLSRPAQ